MILRKIPSIEPIRNSEQSEESHVCPDLRPFTEFILREQRVQGDNQRPFLRRIVNGACPNLMEAVEPVVLLEYRSMRGNRKGQDKLSRNELPRSKLRGL